MKRFVLLSMIFMLLLSSFAVLVSVPGAHASNIIAPGYKNVKDGNSTIDVFFAQNDAYETGSADGRIINYPYEYMASVWANNYDQRVTVAITIKKSVFSDGSQLLVDKAPRAILVQEPEWVNTTLGVKSSGTQSTNWSYATSWPEPLVGLHLPYTTYITFPSMDLPSSTFKPGMFKIEIQMYQKWLDWAYPFVHVGYRTVATIYGEFTVGNVHTDKPTVNPDTQTTYLNATVFSGKWHIRLYYTGEPPSQSDILPNGSVIASDGKIHLVKDFGYFTAADNPVMLSYTYTSNDSTGTYAWTLTSSYNVDTGNETLYGYTLTTHNNEQDNESVFNQKPVVSVNITGNLQVNHDISIIISASDDNSTTISVWIYVYFSSDEYLLPPPWLKTAVLTGFPVDVPNHGQKTINVSLSDSGQLNVLAISQDSQGKYGNEVFKSASVQSADVGGAAGSLVNGNPWIAWPWENTANMVVLLFGVILMFTRRPTLQVIGIVLFFGAFVNWGYVGQYLQQQLTGGIPHLEVWT